MEHHKDDILAELARMANVAQFVSFTPNLRQTHSLVRGYDPDHLFRGVEEAVGAILDASPERSVNIRSFDPASPKSQPFPYGLTTEAEVLSHLRELAGGGLHVIVCETVDVADGGVSGVVHGDIMEFSPGDTPRCVEKPGVVSLDRQVGMELIRVVYGMAPELDFPHDVRVEFSTHPIRRGYQDSHTIVWEVEHLGAPVSAHTLPHWPNNLSRMVGDKAFGLIVAHLLGCRVPRTTVFPRKLPPFTFGSSTGTGETWLRTCPPEPVPGKYTTKHGWTDPFALMQIEDPQNTGIASVLAQEGVDGRYSGALLMLDTGETLIEGVSGAGDAFMVGRVAPELLPDSVVTRVRTESDRLRNRLGPLRLEWVLDDVGNLWVVQLHRERHEASGTMIYPGTPSGFRRFDVAEGLEALRKLVADVARTGEGIVLVGRVGRTSHMCDILRQGCVPSMCAAGLDESEVSLGVAWENALDDLRAVGADPAVAAEQSGLEVENPEGED